VYTYYSLRHKITAFWRLAWKPMCLRNYEKCPFKYNYDPFLLHVRTHTRRAHSSSPHAGFCRRSLYLHPSTPMQPLPLLPLPRRGGMVRQSRLLLTVAGPPRSHPSLPPPPSSALVCTPAAAARLAHRHPALNQQAPQGSSSLEIARLAGREAARCPCSLLLASALSHSS
jgi:hypothetical protein